MLIDKRASLKFSVFFKSSELELNVFSVDEKVF